MTHKTCMMMISDNESTTDIEKYCIMLVSGVLLQPRLIIIIINIYT